MVETATVLAAQQTGHPVRYYGVWKERDEYWRGEAKIMLVIEVGQKLTGQPNGGETDNWQDSSHLSRGRLIDQEVRSISISQKKKKKKRSIERLLSGWRSKLPFSRPSVWNTGGLITSFSITWNKLILWASIGFLVKRKKRDSYIKLKRLCVYASEMDG